MRLNEYEWVTPYNPSHKYIMPNLFKALMMLKVDAGAEILDAGCGAGAICHILYRDMGFKNIYGFDLSLSGIKVAQKKFPELVKNFFVHDCYEKTLPDNVPSIYDVIISTEVIEHLSDPDLYLKNVSSWLKTGGSLVVSTPYHGYLKNLAIVVLNKFDSHFNPSSRSGHIRFFSKKSLCGMLKRNGFKVVRFYGLGRFHWFWRSQLIVAEKI